MNAAEREEIRIHRGLLTEPDGYYSTPIIEGTLTSDTGRMEIIGYFPEAIALAPLPSEDTNMDDTTLGDEVLTVTETQADTLTRSQDGRVHAVSVTATGYGCDVTWISTLDRAPRIGDKIRMRLDIIPDTQPERGL